MEIEEGPVSRTPTATRHRNPDKDGFGGILAGEPLLEDLGKGGTVRSDLGLNSGSPSRGLVSPDLLIREAKGGTGLGGFVEDFPDKED
jgi:hypothetical protein